MTDEVDKNKYVTREHMEYMVAHARVETLLHNLNDSFDSHKKDDSEHFGRLYNADKEILKQVTDIPVKIRSCQRELTENMEKHMEDGYVSIITFNNFANKVVYMASGAIALGTLIGWIVKILVDIKAI